MNAQLQQGSYMEGQTHKGQELCETFSLSTITTNLPFCTAQLSFLCCCKSYNIRLLWMQYKYHLTIYGKSSTHPLSSFGFFFSTLFEMELTHKCLIDMKIITKHFTHCIKITTTFIHHQSCWVPFVPFLTKVFA